MCSWFIIETVVYLNIAIIQGNVVNICIGSVKLAMFILLFECMDASFVCCLHDNGVRDSFQILCVCLWFRPL